MATGIRLSAVLSLKRIAAIKTTVLLWNQINCSPLNDCFEFEEKWQEIEDEVKENIHHLMLPDSLKPELKRFIKPIGTQILKWFEDHRQNFRSFIAFIHKFYWTTQGTIERKKTAQLFVKNGELCAVECYKLACEYCLESDIPVLWSRVPENDRHVFWNNLYGASLCKFWTYLTTNDTEAMNIMIQDEFKNSYSPFQSAFMIAARRANVVATCHFWLKLSSEERNESLLQTAKHLCLGNYRRFDVLQERYGDVMCFLLSKMKEEEKFELFKTQTFGVFICLAHWPFQDVLIESVRFVMKFLEKHLRDVDHRYWLLAQIIVSRQSADCDNCIFKQLFTDVWLQMPVEVKRNAVSTFLIDDEYFCKGDLLWQLFRNRDLRNIKLCFREYNQETKRKILLSRQGSYNCKNLVDADNLDLLEFFIKECASSGDDVAQLKENVELFYTGDVANNVIGKINTIFDPKIRVNERCTSD